MKPKTRSSWETDKSSLDGLFQKALRERASKAGITIVSGEPTPLTIRPSIGWIETGYYRIPAWNAVSVIKMNVVFADARGNVQEEINIQDEKPMDIMFAPDSGGRLRSIAEKLGERLADYLKSRTQGK